MSVLPCARYGCDGIMCDRHSHEHGYICDDCFTELCQMPFGTDIGEFMDTDKKHPPLQHPRMIETAEQVFRDTRREP